MRPGVKKGIRRRIVGLPRESEIAARRGNTDDASVAFAHHRQHRELAHVKRAGEIDVEHRLPVLRFHHRQNGVDNRLLIFQRA